MVKGYFHERQREKERERERERKKPIIYEAIPLKYST